ncbi:MAG: LicD family protein [Candidatus Neomarinimicrobiota bacterium]
MAGNSRLTGKNLTVALKMLKEITTILEKKNIWYCLDGGTLLGIVRENRLLPWDNDLDTFVTKDEYKKVASLTWKFRLRGYWVAVRRHKQDMPPFRKGDPRAVKIRNRRYRLFAGPVCLDIFIKYREGDNYCWREGGREKNVKKSVPAHFFSKVVQREFDGKKYWIPAAYDEYLTYRYKNWRKPVKKWNNLEDDHAIIKDAVFAP